MNKLLLATVIALSATVSFANEVEDTVPTRYKVPSFLRIDLGHEGLVESCGSNEAYSNEPCVKVVGGAALKFLQSLKIGDGAPKVQDPGQIGGN